MSKEAIVQVLTVIQEDPCSIKVISNKTGLDEDYVRMMIKKLEDEHIITKVDINEANEELYYFSRLTPTTQEVDALKQNIIKLNQANYELEEEIQSVDKQSTRCLENVHCYNDMKDLGQMLIGRLSQLEGKTIQELYNEYGMNIED